MYLRRNSQKPKKLSKGRMGYMDIVKMTIKELGEYFRQENVPDEILEACRQDSRRAAQQLVAKYEKQQARQEAEKTRLLEMYRYEREAAARGYSAIAGIDEAGRGPLAGPVSVAAVILPESLLLPKLNDSKKLSGKVRDELYDEIMAKARAVKQVFISSQEIDRINILQATMAGMCQAVNELTVKADFALIDAVKLKQLELPQLSLIKGDAKSASIAAASIIAKVSRDRLMDEYDKQYPQYGFSGHKGYGTAEHIAAIRKYGPCPIHRLTFEPIRSIVAGE